MNKVEQKLKKAFIEKQIKYPVTHIAKEINITKGAVSRCISGDLISPKFDAWILLNLGINMDKLRTKKEEKVS